MLKVDNLWTVRKTTFWILEIKSDPRDAGEDRSDCPPRAVLRRDDERAANLHRALREEREVRILRTHKLPLGRERSLCLK